MLKMSKKLTLFLGSSQKKQKLGKIRTRVSAMVNKLVHLNADFCGRQ